MLSSKLYERRISGSLNYFSEGINSILQIVRVPEGKDILAHKFFRFISQRPFNRRAYVAYFFIGIDDYNGIKTIFSKGLETFHAVLQCISCLLALGNVSDNNAECGLAIILNNL